MLEHGKELLKEEKYEEAYNFFKEHYDKFKDIESYYYCATIDFYNFGNKTMEQYYQMFMYLYKKAPKKFLGAYINQLATTALNSNHPDMCYKVIQEGKSKGMINGYLMYLMAQSSWILYRNYQQSIGYCEEALAFDDVDESLGGAINEHMAIMTAIKFGTEKALDIVSNMYIKYNNKDAIDWTELKVYFAVNDKEKIREFINKNQDREIIVGYINDVVEYYEKNYNVDELLYYIEIIRDKYIDKYSSKEFVENYYCALLLEKKKFDEVLKIINNLNLEKTDKETYLDLMNKKFFIYNEKHLPLEAGKVAVEVSEKYKEVEWLFNVVDYKTHIGEYNEALKVNEEIEKIIQEKNLGKDYKDHLTFNYIRGYRYLGRFDEAFKLTKKINMKNNFYVILRQILSVSPNPKKWYSTYSLIASKSKNALGYYDLSKMYFHGEYNVKVNINKALEYINKSLDISKDACAYSLLGNIHLSNNEIDKAFELFKKYESGIFDENECICGPVFYCYIMYIKNMKDKAYDYLVKLKTIYKNRLNENFVLLFAKLSCELGKNLNEALELANNYYERRYSPNIYLARVILKKELGINYEEDQKMFKKSLNFVGKREKEYYLNNPDGIYMNNF